VHAMFEGPHSHAPGRDLEFYCCTKSNRELGFPIPHEAPMNIRCGFAFSLYKRRRGGCELRHGSFCTASSNQNVVGTSIQMLYFSFTYHGKYVKFTPIIIILAGSCILYLHIIMYRYFGLQLHVQVAFKVCVPYRACNGLVIGSL